MKSSREIRLERALGTLIRKYWHNKGTDSEFITVITPTSIPDYWRAADEALSEHPLCEFEGCTEMPAVGLNDRQLCYKHFESETKRIGKMLKELVGSLHESIGGSK